MTNPISDSYESWISRVMGGRSGRPTAPGELVRSSEGAPFDTIEFARLEREKYVGEVGKKLGDYVYHFFPAAGQQFPKGFGDRMAEAFVAVFQFEERLEAAFSESLNSWAVRAKGFAVNPLADDMALSIFPALDKLLE